MEEKLFDYTDDVILPDGFDPNDENFTLDQLGSETAAEAAPTTEQVQQPAAESEAQPTQEPTTVPTESTELTESTQLQPQTIKVKFNHEERELSLDEAALFAQKGMNYDKLEAKIAGYEASAQRYGALAKKLGYESQDEMIAAAEQNFVNRRIKELKAEGNTDAMAKFLVEQEMAKAAVPTVQVPQSQGTPTPVQSAPGMSTEREAELKEFVKAYPGITKLPEEVITANRQGVRLILAYERHMNKQAQAEAQKANQAQQQEIAILKQNQASAAKAPVTGATGKAGSSDDEGPIDPFLKGFDSAY